MDLSLISKNKSAGSLTEQQSSSGFDDMTKHNEKVSELSLLDSSLINKINSSISLTDKLSSLESNASGDSDKKHNIFPSTDEPLSRKEILLGNS